MLLFTHFRHQRCLRRLFIAFFAISSLLSPFLSAQQPNTPPKNFDLCDTLLRQSSRLLAKQLRQPLFPQDTLYVQVVSHEGSWMLESSLFSEMKRIKRFRANDSLHHRFKLSVRITDLATRYFATEGQFDMIAREVSCGLAATIETDDGVVQPLEPIQQQYHDTIPRQTISTLESKQYSFTTSSLPEAKPDFWKQVLEPAIIIVSGALIVALFFLVRTQ